jgi:3-hydroxybutyryl-CoA dehydratase
MPNQFREQMIKGVKPGDQFIIERTFTKEETTAFGDLTQDYNPVHYDRRWTDAKNLNGLICHGLLVGSMICEFGGQVGWLASGMSFKFIKPVYFNDTIQCRIKLIALDDRGRAKARARFFNQNEEQIGVAELSGRLPLDPERKILQKMVSEGDPTNKLADKTYF